MKTYLFAALALLLVGTSTVHAQEREQPQPEAPQEQAAEEQSGIQWLRDAAEAKRKADAEGKKLFIVWGTEW